MNKENKNKNAKNCPNQINIYHSNGSEKIISAKQDFKTTSNQELYYVEDLDKNHDQSHDNNENL